MSKSANTIIYISTFISIGVILFLVIFLNQDITPPVETIEKPIAHEESL